MYFAQPMWWPGWLVSRLQGPILLSSDERDWVLTIDTGSRLSESLFRDWDGDFDNPNPFYETGIKTFKMPIPFSRLGSRLSKCHSLFRDWDRDSKLEGDHCDRDSQEDPALITVLDAMQITGDSDSDAGK